MGGLRSALYFLINDMYILINKQPVDVFRIKDITGIIPLDMKRYRSAVARLEYPTFKCLVNGEIKEKYKVEANIATKIICYIVRDIRGMRITDDNVELPLEYTASEMMDPNYENKIYGYYFCIKPEDKNIICSKIYKTMEEAEKKLKDILELINTIRDVIAEVEI